MNASSVKPKPKKANKVEITSDEPKGETQINATTPTTPRVEDQSLRLSQRLLHKLLRREWRISRQKIRRKVRVVEKESEESPSPE